MAAWPSRAVTATALATDLPPTSLDNGQDNVELPRVMISPLTQAEVLIALVVAAHAGILAVRLAVSLYKA